ncbi:MAG: glycosyltransferase family 4 protein [Candidatus Bathyarchaeota archaeon]|nr:glycosyltransferase family 4 protein [Candidatus Bathyarchaeota archaeon]
MNVLIIGEYFPPDLGGAATRASNVAKGLSINNCNVTVVTAFPHYPTGKIPKEYHSKPLKVEYAGKIRIIRTWILPLESKGILRRLFIFTSFIVSSMFALLLVGNIDVIWAANPDIFVLIPAIAYGGIKRKPVVSNVDDLIIEDLYDLNLVKRGSATSKLAEFFARFLFSKVKAATPISPGYVETIARYGVNRRMIQVVRGGVDLEVFKPYPKRGNSGKFVVMYSGGFSIAYDFEQVFQAAKIIQESNSDVEFIIQGKGELLGSMQSRVKELKLKNVQIIDKLLPREAVSEFLSQADVLILPLADFKTPYRGMSSKLYEYQAVGKPIISCSQGLPSHYVIETSSGLTVNPGDFQALAQAVFCLKENQKLCRLMGSNGQKFVEISASINAIGLKMRSLFRNLPDG